MKAACLEGALSRQEPCGVWGGELFVEGQIVAAKRSVGRPRLNPLTPAQLIAEVSDVPVTSEECDSDDEALAS
jgi:WhiB family redox-sensing transcriptional regulator